MVRHHGSLPESQKGASVWLGRQDSNLRMLESKSSVLPLDDAPIYGMEDGVILSEAQRYPNLSRKVKGEDKDNA